ncbi:MAG TPA: isochorismatase family cysteine hydrolase [Actinomycetota bacterium]|nr:isochorismatase family cysteine hydrolase [Actinomycetota bacterium]
MSLEPLPRGATAMLVVELQNDLVHPSLVGAKGLSGKLAEAVQNRGVLPRLASLLDRCRTAGVPVLYATKERHPSIPPPTFPAIYRAARSTESKLVAGTWGAQIVDEIAPQGSDIVLPRYTSIDASYGSDLWAVLRNLGAATLVIAGISTTMAVEGVVRAAANRALRVVVVEDCCASFPEEWHRFSADNILPLLADVVPAAAVEAALG